MIELTNICKTFQDGNHRQNHVLENLSLRVSDGEFIAIKGASGSGKTTLLNILGLLLKPDSGQYMLDGENVYADISLIPKLRNEKLGFVFQDHRLIPQYNVLQNILLPTLAYRQSPTNEQVEYAHRLMQLVGIDNLAMQSPSTLSGGESSRVALCRALIMKPLLLLADEPTGQLDHENAANIMQVLQDINQTLRTTIIMVTHSDETAQAAQTIYNLQNRQLQ